MTSYSTWILILFCTVMGAGIVAMLAVNVVKLSGHRREMKNLSPTSALGKWAWGLSVFSLVFFYVAPVSLVMGFIDLRRSEAGGDSAAQRPARMAILNSILAVVTLVATVLVLFGTGVLLWPS